MKSMMKQRQNHSMRRTTSRRGGQALIEMAAVVMVLVLLTMGMLQYGIIYNTSIQLTNLAREGARYGAVHGTEATVVADTRTYLREIATRTVIAPSALTNANVEVTATTSAGTPFTVTIYYDMTKKFIVPTAKWAGLQSAAWQRKPSSATMIVE